MNIHIASFPELGDVVSVLPIGLSRVEFYPLKGKPYMKRLELEEDKLSDLSHLPGLSGATACRNDLPTS